MERISEILDSYKIGTPTPRQSSGQPTEPAETPSPDKLRQKLLWAGLSVPSLGHTFKAWKQTPGATQAVKASRQLSTEPTASPLLMLCGGVGNGKTYLAEALVIDRVTRGLPATYRVWSELLGLFYRAMRVESGLPSPDELLMRYSQSVFLVLDDVGAGSVGSDWEWGRLEAIVVYRYRERLPLLITTNKDITAIPERIISRFSETGVGRIIINTAPDYRTKMGG